MNSEPLLSPEIWERTAAEAQTHIRALEARVAAPVERSSPSHQQTAAARAYVHAQPAAYVDETGWRQGPQRAWLWTVVTAWVTLFAVRRLRSGQVAQELLGECYWGWLVTDLWSGCSWYPPWRRKLCWAHVARDMEAMIARGGPSQVIGEGLRAQVQQIFHWWHRVRDGTLVHASFASYIWISSVLSILLPPTLSWIIDLSNTPRPFREISHSAASRPLAEVRVSGFPPILADILATSPTDNAAQLRYKIVDREGMCTFLRQQYSLHVSSIQASTVTNSGGRSPCVALYRLRPVP